MWIASLTTLCRLIPIKDIDRDCMQNIQAMSVVFQTICAVRCVSNVLTKSVELWPCWTGLPHEYQLYSATCTKQTENLIENEEVDGGNALEITRSAVKVSSSWHRGVAVLAVLLIPIPGKRLYAPTILILNGPPIFCIYICGLPFDPPDIWAF